MKLFATPMSISESGVADYNLMWTKAKAWATAYFGKTCFVTCPY